MGVRALRAVTDEPDPRLCEMRLIPLMDLVIPGTYQRARDEKRCQKAAANFDPNLFHPLVVERSAGNKWNVNQGQHRRRIAEIVGIPAVWCMIARTDKPGETFVDAAREQKPLKAHEQHRALASDRHPQALRVDHILASYGFRLAGRSGAPGTLNCVTAIYVAMFGADSKIGRESSAYGDIDQDGLVFALRAIRDSWGVDNIEKESRGGSMLIGLCILHEKYGEEIDFPRLCGVLTKAGARLIDSRASGRRRAEDGSHGILRTREIAERYNHSGRRKLDLRKLYKGSAG